MTNSFFNNLEERKKKEIEHSDRRRQIVTGYEYYTDASKSDEKVNYITNKEEYNEHFSNAKFYSITKSSFSYRDTLLYTNIKNCVVLDYCCGNGEIGIAMAKSGTKMVHGIDISEVSINNANNLAADEGFEKNCYYEVMDAENLKYEDNIFDLIHEYGALHHVDLDAALRETSRVLKSDGKLICTEALRHNPFIHWYRKRTMHLRTQWEVEHILGVSEIMLGKKYFDEVEIRYFHLFSLAAIPFRKYFFFPLLLAFLDMIDCVILRIPYIQRLAWIAVIEYKKPRKNS